MAKTVTRTFDYQKFSCLTNKWYSELKEVSRPMTKQEQKIENRYCRCMGLALISIPFALIASIIYGSVIGNSLWGLMIIPFAIGEVFFFSTFLNKAFKLEDAIRHFGDYGFDTEKLIWEGAIEEQKKICELWRAQHPFEEAIRKAQESKSSVDIAELARYYAEHYIKGE